MIAPTDYCDYCDGSCRCDRRTRLPFKPLGARVVIKADREDHAPETTDSGLVLAKTLAAAVEGSDAEDSWFVGTVVALGPLVNRFDVRAFVLRELREEYNGNGCLGRSEIDALCAFIRGLPQDNPDPIHLGDRVVFSWAAGQQLTIDDEKYLILHHSEILAVLE